MARTKRVMISMEPAMHDELKAMADALKMPLSTFIMVILQIGMASGSEAVLQFGNTLEGLIAADREHDAES